MGNKKYRRVLSIAGTDPSGGAGIQADLKAFSACGCYATTAITAVVDQNTQGVKAVHPLPVDFVKGQITSVLDDIGADAIKIGMLHSSELILGIKETLQKYNIKNIVLDPVMVATSGDTLLQQEAIATLKKELIPMVRVLTPNLPEAEILLGKKIENQEDFPAIAKKLASMYNVSVLLKAGHLKGDELIDVFYNNETDETVFLPSKRVYTQNTHGTGCTFSSALAAFLTYDISMNEAVEKAKEYMIAVIDAGATYKIGKGHGPVHHFYKFWD